MYYDAFARFNNVKVLELDTETTIDEVKNFISSTTQQKYKDIKAVGSLNNVSNKGTIIIEFSEEEKTILVPGSLLFSAFKELYYVLAEDAEEFKEFFCVAETEKHYKKPSRPKIKKKRIVNNSDSNGQFVCPICNYISDVAFEKCPSCGGTNESYNNLNECTDLSTKVRNNKMAFDLDKIREEQCKDTTPTEVTAVYGDNVSVSKDKSDEEKQEETTESSNI